MRTRGEPEYEYVQCHATLVNATDFRMNLIEIGPDMWGKWIQSPTDVPARSTIQFSAQGRAMSPSGTECVLTYQLIGSDPGAVITIHFDVPYSGSVNYEISCKPVGAFKVSETHNDLKDRHSHVKYVVA